MEQRKKMQALEIALCTVEVIENETLRYENRLDVIRFCFKYAAHNLSVLTLRVYHFQ